ncbi:MAG TPA: hypothetical protein VH062_00340 [Polyangiaceae bacterium]|jgi:hypothetical protein|nr:hypothetical protein [Polyangiaceae bacterium]
MRVSAEDGIAILSWVVEEGIKPHAETIARIVKDDSVAVVLFNVHPSVADVPRNLGWDGASPVFRMSSRVRKRFAKHLGNVGDVVAQRWFSCSKPGRIFVFVELGTFLSNHDRDGNFTVEPGSTGCV